MGEAESVASLDDLKSLYGDLRDGDEHSRRFRELISKDKWNLRHFESWIEEAIEKKFSKEFQDIVVAVGKRIGFDGEFGHYAGAQGRIGYDGIWTNKQGLLLVLETKLGSWIRQDVNQLGGYIDAVRKERGTADDKIYGLYVVGDPSDLGALADQVRGSRYSGKIRIISAKNLLKLAKFYVEFGLSNEQLARLVIPIDAVNVGELVDLIETIIQEEAIRKETPPLLARASTPMITGELTPISREQLATLPAGDVPVCPSRPEGVDFVKTYNAWGFIRIGRTPKYFALYISSPFSEVKYFAEVDKIVDPRSAESPVTDPERYDEYSEGKKIILFKRDSLRELMNPIPRREKWSQGMFYTTKDKLATSDSLDSIIG